MCVLCGKQTSLFLNTVNKKKYWYCSNCDLVYLDPIERLKAEDEQSRYEEHNNALDDPRYIAYLKGIFDEAVAPFTVPSKALDFGCGPTKGMETVMTNVGYRVLSYDPFFFDEPRLLHQKYQVITVIEAAEHFCDPKNVFSQLFELLDDQGILVVKTYFRPILENFNQWWYIRDDTHVSLYSKKTMRFIAEMYKATIIYENEKDIVVYQKQH